MSPQKKRRLLLSVDENDKRVAFEDQPQFADEAKERAAEMLEVVDPDDRAWLDRALDLVAILYRFLRRKAAEPGMAWHRRRIKSALKIAQALDREISLFQPITREQIEAGMMLTLRQSERRRLVARRQPGQSSKGRTQPHSAQLATDGPLSVALADFIAGCEFSSGKVRPGRHTKAYITEPVSALIVIWQYCMRKKKKFPFSVRLHQKQLIDPSARFVSEMLQTIDPTIEDNEVAGGIARSLRETRAELFQHVNYDEDDDFDEFVIRLLREPVANNSRTTPKPPKP